MAMEPYNGYSGRERERKKKKYLELRDEGKSIPAVPPCQLCRNPDPELKIQRHCEDYSQPYLWTPPAEYLVCKACYQWIHIRFDQPESWRHFKAHIKRGGYADEFEAVDVRAERKAASDARAKGVKYVWKPIQGRTFRNGTYWWEKLSLSVESKTATTARPRP